MTQFTTLPQKQTENSTISIKDMTFEIKRLPTNKTLPSWFYWGISQTFKEKMFAILSKFFSEKSKLIPNLFDEGSITLALKLVNKIFANQIQQHLKKINIIIKCDLS